MGWTKYFGALIGALDAKRDKPAPDPINLCLADSAIAAGPDVWYVGDTEMDMECALAAQCVPVLMLEKPVNDLDFNGYRPAIEFSSPLALMEYLK